MHPTEHVGGTPETAPERSAPGRQATTHAAFALLVAATFAIFLALSLPLSRLGSNLFTSGGLLSPKGGPITNILGLPGLPGLSDLVPGAAHAFGSPGVTGVLAPVPPVFGPADIGPPPPPGTVVTPPVVSGGGVSTGSGDTAQPRPQWWRNLTPGQRHAVTRHMTLVQWKHDHALQHKVQQAHKRRHHRHSS